MRCFPRYLLFALTVSYLVSCMNAGPDVQTPVQEPVTYEDTVYCFNQRSVVSLEGKKGLISGSHVRAGKKITAKVIGSDMGSDTVLEVGTDPTKKARLVALMKQNEELNQTIKRIMPVLTAFKQKLASGEKFSPEKVEQARVLSGNFVTAQKQLGENNTEIEALKEALKEATDAVVEVSDRAYAGTKLVIADSPLVLKAPYQHCRFVKQGADVKMAPK